MVVQMVSCHIKKVSVNDFLLLGSMDEYRIKLELFKFDHLSIKSDILADNNKIKIRIIA